VDTPSWNKTTPENVVESNASSKPSLAASPPPVLQNTAGKPLLAQPAGFSESSDPKIIQEVSKDSVSATTVSEPAKPWIPLILVSILLFASIGGNVYLLWIFAELRKRYRATFAR
jgi:hypothetical protein